ncbi:cellulase family glycosylhydrolase [Flavimarina sp. Hel_I_48]|uniref:cellulase family glycosylhydrolase n=1 Tax=Flavimarina sp. Hel_I_48 TaxID=1392488 RepID=UPI0004DF709A|nr:cellulase family glycosylhydrolase [Flavimarina sp. Hel_I_48]
MKFNYLLPALLLFTTLTFAQDFLKTDGTRIVNANNENVLLRGIGLGGYMLQEGYMLKVPFSGQQYVFKEHVEELIGAEKTKAFYSAWRENFIQKADIDSLKRWGFNSVRLPMHYNLYTLPVYDEPIKGKNTWLETGFALTDSLVNWCRANNMHLILDMHAAPGGQGHDVNISDRDPTKPSLWESHENQQKLTDLWVKLAEKYKDEPVIGAYDIINEPNWSFEVDKNENGTQDTKNVLLRQLMVNITNAIRKVDQNHIIIIEGNGWGNNYNGVLPPWGDNMVLSFHKYWNNNDQGSIQQFLDYREKYQIPIWLGESGENSNTWFTDAIALMEKNNIGWCWWPLKKLGSNNPLEIKINPGYQKILEYWRGDAEKPSAGEAEKAFIQLAENTKITNNIVQKNVIDAMMRQSNSDKTLPYKMVNIQNRGTILAADYDMGKNGIAYNDNGFGNYYISTGGERTTGNLGHTYRNDGVDIFKMENKSDSVYVGDLEKGEWMIYTFQTENEGDYLLKMNISAKEKGGNAMISINQMNEKSIEIPNTSGDWKTVDFGNISLKKGENQLKFNVNQGGFNIESFQFESKK